jgi:hypothetical protein
MTGMRAFTMLRLCVGCPMKAMRFAFENPGVDNATIGLKSMQEIDEAINNMNLALG